MKNFYTSISTSKELHYFKVGWNEEKKIKQDSKK